jgi:hypothetical protein
MSDEDVLAFAYSEDEIDTRGQTKFFWRKNGRIL